MTSPQKDVVATMKSLLADPTKKIQLDDFVTGLLRSAIQAVGIGQFPVQASNFQKEEFAARLKAYEETIKDLQQAMILLARWAEGESLFLIEKVITRLSESDRGTAGMILWLRLSWYPLQLLMYSAGISALSARRYTALRVILSTHVLYRPDEGKTLPLASAVSINLSDVVEQFKNLPDFERRRTPMSDYVFQVVHQPLEEILFLGRSYEQLFDEYEVYLSLVCLETNGRWSPVGRFGWKYEREGSGSPLHRILSEAKTMADKWGPISAGFFGGSPEEFNRLATALSERVAKLDWW